MPDPSLTAGSPECGWWAESEASPGSDVWRMGKGGMKARGPCEELSWSPGHALQETSWSFHLAGVHLSLTVSATCHL